MKDVWIAHSETTGIIGAAESTEGAKRLVVDYLTARDGDRPKKWKKCGDRLWETSGVQWSNVFAVERFHVRK